MKSWDEYVIHQGATVLALVEASSVQLASIIYQTKHGIRVHQLKGYSFEITMASQWQGGSLRKARRRWYTYKVAQLESQIKLLKINLKEACASDVLEKMP